MGAEDYQKSISAELKAVQDRVRHLIGSANWGEEGRYKEAALRTVLRRVLPSNISIGTGFIVSAEQISSQIDIIVWDNTYPIAFNDGDFVVVPPECVKGIIEVKTRLSQSNIEHTIKAASENSNLLTKTTFNGVFAYDSDLLTNDVITIKLRSALENSKGKVNHLTLGENIFIKFWGSDRVFSSDSTPTFDEYSIYRIKDLAFPYFISNLIADVARGKGDTLSWFLYPIPNGKETYKICSVQTNT